MQISVVIKTITKIEIKTCKTLISGLEIKTRS